MIIILTGKKLKEIKDNEYYSGIVKGVELGKKLQKQEDSNLGFIIGGQADEEIAKILRNKTMEL